MQELRFEEQVLRRLDVIIALMQAASESQSSVEVASSTRGVDIKAKAYAARVEDAGRQAVDEYLRSRDDLNARGVRVMQEQVASMQTGRR